MSRELELLSEIRDLLQIIAEPTLAKRDEATRSSLRAIVGGSEKKARAVLLMDGSRTQSAIVKESKIDQGNLSRFVKRLAAAELITDDPKQPKLAIPIPPNFFDEEGSK